MLSPAGSGGSTGGRRRPQLPPAQYLSGFISAGLPKLAKLAGRRVALTERERMRGWTVAAQMLEAVQRLCNARGDLSGPGSHSCAGRSAASGLITPKSAGMRE